MLKQKTFLFKTIIASSIAISQWGYAGLTFGDKESTAGQVDIGGAIRGKYVYDDYSDPTTSKFSFSDAILRIDYESNKIIGHLDYRAYEYYGHLGDASWLTDAWVGYKIDDKNKVIAGLNPVPFGIDRFWGKTFYLGMGNAMGLEDVHNLGLKYQHKTESNQLDLAFYPTDGGNFQGHSKDSRRYSINMVNADDYVVNGTNTKEKNMLVARYVHQFKYDDLNYKLGASAWYSDIENKNTHATGSRKVWSIFTDMNYENWSMNLLLGHQKIDNKDDLYPDHITLGGFDASFNSATEGDFFSTEVSYLFPQKFEYINSIRPYINYSGYINKKGDSADSFRIIPGLSFMLKDITIQAEYLIGKHDPYLGDANGLANGSNDKWNKKANVSIAYYF